MALPSAVHALSGRMNTCVGMLVETRAAPLVPTSSRPQGPAVSRSLALLVNEPMTPLAKPNWALTSSPATGPTLSLGMRASALVMSRPARVTPARHQRASPAKRRMRSNRWLPRTIMSSPPARALSCLPQARISKRSPMAPEVIDFFRLVTAGSIRIWCATAIRRPLASAALKRVSASAGDGMNGFSM